MYGLTKKQQKALVVRLKEMKAGDYCPIYGVCTNVENCVDDVYNITRDLGYKDYVYPLGGSIIYNKHFDNGTLWVGYQKKKRMKLVDEMIELLEVK